MFRARTDIIHVKQDLLLVALGRPRRKLFFSFFFVLISNEEWLELFFVCESVSLSVKPKTFPRCFYPSSLSTRNTRMSRMALSLAQTIARRPTKQQLKKTANFLQTLIFTGAAAVHAYPPTQKLQSAHPAFSKNFNTLSMQVLVHI